MNAPETPAPMGVYRKLQEARIRLNSQAIKKGARNEFAKYNYMELADFLIPTQQIFQELGLCGIVSFAPEIATLTITDMDTGAQVSITSPMSTAALKGCHEVQNLGAVQTYLRRYLWVAAMEIVEHDAIDSAEPTKASKVAKDPMGQDGQESANQIPAPSRIISAAEEAYKSLDDGDRDYLISAVSNAVKVYEKTPSLIEIDNYFMTCKLSTEQKAAIPYLLRGSKTKEGKNLHTAWVNYTKSETPLAEAM